MYAHGSTSVLVHFRKSGRELLKSPDSTTRHLKRLQAALHMEGREPLQGALSDAWHACEDGPAVVADFLTDRTAEARLGQRLAQTVRRAALGGQPLARVKIGRASCRERVIQSRVIGLLVNKLACATRDKHSTVITSRTAI